MIAENEMKALDLPADQAARVRDSIKKAEAKFAATYAKVALTDKTNWIHLGNTSPQCLPRDQTGAKNDIFKYAQGTIQIETNGKNDWLPDRRNDPGRTSLAYHRRPCSRFGECGRCRARRSEKAALRRKIRNCAS